MKIIITEQQYKLLTESNVDAMQHLIDMCVSEIKSNCEKGTYVRGYPVCDQIDTVDEFKVTKVEKHNLEYGSYLEIVIDAYYDSIFPYMNLEHLEWELSQEADEIIGKGTIQVKLNGINKRKNFDW